MKKNLLYTFAVAGVAVLGMAGFGGGEASAASVTVPSEDYLGTTAGIQAAIDQADAGDTITIAEGEYELSDFIDIKGKSNLTLAGSGEVILKYDGFGAETGGIRQAIRIFDSEGITIDNLTIQASNPENESDWAKASSGLGINSSCDININKVNISGFGGYGGILVTRLNDADVTYDCPAGDITFDTLTLTNNNVGIFFTDGATDPANGDIDGVVFEGTNTFVAGDYSMPDVDEDTFNYAIASSSRSGGTVGVGVYGPDGARLNVGVLVASGYPDHHWLAAKGQVALVMPGSTLDDVAVEDIKASDLADTYCLELLKEECPEGMIEDEDGNCVCPEGMVQDEDGNCVCPEGMIEDEDGNCVCPEGSEMNEDGECVPTVPQVPDTGGGIIRDLMQSGAVWVIGIGGGVAIGSVLVTRWAKKYNRIKL